MPTYKTQVIILKIKDLGEFDQLITFYTKDFGKLTVIAKSTKKPTAKLKEQLALFNLGQVKIAQGKTIDKLATIFATESFLNIKSSLAKTAAGLIILEIIDKLISGQQKDQKLWQLLLGVLDYLENLTGDYRHRSRLPSAAIKESIPTIKKIQICLAIFQIKMLKILGFEPNLYQCIQCRKKLHPQANRFSLKQGGILCCQCSVLNNKIGFNKQKLSWQKSNTHQANPGFLAGARNDKDFSNAQYSSHNHHLIPLSTTTIKLWRFLNSQSLKTMPLIKISPAILIQLNQVLISFLEYTSSQQLRSWQFYRKIIQGSEN